MEDKRQSRKASGYFLASIKKKECQILSIFNVAIESCGERRPDLTLAQIKKRGTLRMTHAEKSS